MPATYTCKQCGNAFIGAVRPRKPKFCSLACRGVAQSRAARVAKKCEACGKEFMALSCYMKKGPVRFCSRECYETGRLRIDVEARFWEKVSIAGTDDCWLWTGCISKHGYGKMALVSSRPVGAHRISYMLANGSIPSGKQINHTCDVRNCVNPKHLYAGTAKQNTGDAIARGRWWSPFVHG